MKTSPLVSVLMTAWNRERYIAEAIESVLASTYRSFELIIVDDCSRDRTVDIARKYEMFDTRVKVYVNEKNLGDYPNRNRAASYSAGEFLKYVDSDDILQPEALDTLIRGFEQFPNSSLAFTANEADGWMDFPVQFRPEDVYRKYFYGNSLLNKGPSASMIRANVFFQEGGFSNAQFVSDTDFWLRISRNHNVILVKPNLLVWRIHEDQQIALERSNSLIEKIRLDNIEQLLKDSASPLSEKEREQIIRNIRSIKVRSIGKNLLSLKMLTAYRRFRKLELTAVDVFHSLRRNNTLIR